MSSPAEPVDGQDPGLEGRVVIVTGAGQGLGRTHALELARHGAKVVVNDLPRASDDGQSAEAVVAEIVAAGGVAVAAPGSVADWKVAEWIVTTAVAEFGELHAVVNNAGLTRHRPLPEMTEADWDLVLDVNLKGAFAMTRHAAAYWKGRADSGAPVAASVVNTSSRGALFSRAAGLTVGSPGVSNYASAKGAIATFSEVAARELAAFGVRVNCISPSARTRLTLTPRMASIVAAPTGDGPDEWDPANISPVVAWLCSESCSTTGATFWVKGPSIGLLRSWTVQAQVVSEQDRWSLEELQRRHDELVLADDADSAINL